MAHAWNGCSQSSRFRTAGQGERSSGNEIVWRPELHEDDESSLRSSAVRGNRRRPLGSSSSVLKVPVISLLWTRPYWCLIPFDWSAQPLGLYSCNWIRSLLKLQKRQASLLLLDRIATIEQNNLPRLLMAENVPLIAENVSIFTPLYV